MTALDDALNSSSVQTGPHQILANWRETWSGEKAANPEDSLNDLSGQSDGSLQITHSMDDALPDPVTMTVGNDASGVLSAGMGGRAGLVRSNSGIRTGTPQGNSTSSKTHTVPLPTTTTAGDSLLSVVLVSSATANVYQVNSDPKDTWELIATSTDAPHQMLVYFKRRWNPNNPALMLASDTAVNFQSWGIPMWGTNPAGSPLDYRVHNATTAVETGTNVTPHSITALQPVAGYTVALFGYPLSAGPMTMTAPMTSHGNPSNLDGQVLGVAISPFRDAGNYTSVGTTQNGTSIVAMVALTMEPVERPTMSARQYFSPINRNSPIYGFDRDTADVTASIRIGTASGPVDTQVFSGQMQGVAVEGDGASVAAVSKTRIWLNRTVTAPIVGGYREGLTVDWFVTWLAARGSQFVGPAPSRYTRYWAPMHGSVHPHTDAVYGYNSTTYVSTAVPLTTLGRKNPVSVDGPYSLGMFAGQTATRTDIITMSPRQDLMQAGSPFPHIVSAGGPLLNDVFSQGNSRGRLCFYLRADAATSAPSYLNSVDDYLFSFRIQCNSREGAFLGWLKMEVDSANRRALIQMGSDAAGYTTVTYGASGLLPTDGAWHFIGFWWDFAAGTARVVVDNTESSSSSWATNGNNVTTQLPVTDAQGVARGDKTICIGFAHLPISEVMLDFGQTYPGFSLWDDYRSTVAPGKSMTLRPIRQSLAGIAEPAAINCWDTLASLARSSLSWYRVNEADNLEFLPPSYFGETAQTTPSSVQDTSTNSATPDIVTDPSKSRNVVTVQFNDSRVDTSPQAILRWNTAIEIPRGRSYFTFPTDVPYVEMHGAVDVASTSYQILNLTSGQIATPSTIPAGRHFMTVNANQEGTGSVLSEFQVTASITEVDAQSVLVTFVNTTSGNAYLANNGDQVPFLQMLGYGLRSVDGYSTVRDESSVAVRGERGLEAGMEWIHDREVASDVAASLLTIVGHLRNQIKIRVAGDPRRKPGQLVTVLDTEQSGISGNWRVLSVTHDTSGAQYTQDLQLLQQLPVALWDGPDGWDEGVWS